MLEDELRTVAERVAPEPHPDLETRVLARLDARPTAAPWRLRVVAAVAVVLAALGLSPQLRAFAADLLAVAGIEVTDSEPDSRPVPEQPIPGTRWSDLDRAAAEAEFSLSVPAALGEPQRVRVADGGRIVTMTWRDGDVVLDQFRGTLGPVFAKEVGGLGAVRVDLGGDLTGTWIPGPHDLTYVDGSGATVEATARLAGRTLIWEGGHGVSFRLEGEDLARPAAVRVARSLVGTS